MFNTEFNPEIAPEFAAIDLYPAPLQAEIEAQNEWVYPTVNNGVYRSGFATKQKAYEEAVIPLFESLDRLEKLLEGGKTFIIGDQLTECDVRLFTTIVSACVRLWCFARADDRAFAGSLRSVRSFSSHSLRFANLIAASTSLTSKRTFARSVPATRT